MAPTVVMLPFTAGPPPADWKPSEVADISELDLKYKVYPAGPSFIGAARRKALNLSFKEDDEQQAAMHHERLKAKIVDGGEDLYPGLGEEAEDKTLLMLDPKEWKKQDHYAVLGLGNLRYTASEDQIRIAHRRKVLRHHPDKKAGQVGHVGTNDDSFFKCIGKAFDTVINPETRKQFDSIDPSIEDHVPNPKDVKADDFVQTYAPVFAREARFSKTQPVPGFGSTDSPKSEVERFYDFWYNFDSWRSFEMWDKEVQEGGDSRDEKRYQEKKNKAERARHKKEDNTRLREMVDMILAADPRIKRFKAEEKAAREAKKKGGAAGGKAKPLTPAEKKAAEAKKVEEAKKAAEEAKAKEAEDKVSREAAKKAKEAAKKNLKKWKKSITTVVADSNYFQAEGTQASAQVIEKQLGEIDALVDALEPEQVRELKESVEKAGKGPAAKEAIKAKVALVEDKSKYSEFA